MITDINTKNEVTAVHKPVKQLVVTIASQVLSWAFAMIVTFILPKYRSVAEFAIFSVMFGYVSLVNTLGDSGMSVLIARTVSIQPNRTWRLLLAAAILKFGVSVAAIGVLSVFFMVIKYDRYTSQFVVYGILCSVISQLGTMVKDAIRGFGRVSTSSVIQLLERGIATGVTVGLAVTRQPLVTFVLVPVLVDIAFGAFSLRTLSKFVVGETKSDYRLAHEVKFLFGQALLISSGLLIIQFKDPLNLLLMDYWGNVDSIGGYSVMKRLLGSAVFLAVAVSQLGLPMLTRAWGTGQNAFTGQLRTLLQASIILALPVTVGFAFHGDNILTLLGLYPKFIYGPVAMAVSAPMVLLLYIAMLLTNAIVASGKQSQLAKGSIKVTLVAPLSSIVFIYVAHRLSSNSSLGAILGDIFIEVLLVCVYHRILDVKVISKRLVTTIAKAVLLCIPLAFAGMLPNGVFWIVATVGALGLYAGALYKMGLLHKRMLEVGEESIR